MRKKVIKPFDIEKAKNGAEVCTRDGRKARITCFDAVTKDDFPLVTLILDNGVEDTYWHTIYGRGSSINEETEYDLFLVEYEEEQPQFKPFDKVLARDSDYEIWRCDFFSHYYNDDVGYPFGCMSACYSQCIPFEGNEHLVGTTDMPK